MSTPSRAATLGATLAVLWAAHDLADHVVQTDHQAARKATSWRAMAGHVGGYHAVQLLALVLLRRAGVRPSWSRTLAAVAWSAGTHAFLDRRWPVRRTLELTRSPGFARPEVRVHLDVDGHGAVVGGAGVPRTVDVTGPLPLHGPYLADQALHHAALAVSAAILAASTPKEQ